MREIKFRAWDPKYKEMIEDIHIAPEYDWLVLSDNDALAERDNRDRSLEEEYVLMQYTGLKDRNGKKIYPQDIIKWDGGFRNNPLIGEVVEEWGSVGPCAGPNMIHYIIKLPPDICHKEPHSFHNTWKLDEMEVIGNIYENPTQLKENK